MKSPLFKLLALSLVATSFLTGCPGCRPDPIPQSPRGVVSVISGSDATGTSNIGTSEIDFGSKFMGTEHKLKFTIRNTGIGSLSLNSLTVVPTEGASPTSTGDAVSNPVFITALPEKRDLGSQESAEIEVTFKPPLEDVISKKHFAVLTLEATNTDPGAELTTLTVRGEAVQGVCDLPAEIDFGNVVVNDEWTVNYTIRNPTQIEATSNVGDITSSSGGASVFRFTGDSLRGTTVLDPESEHNLGVVFAPTSVGEFRASITVKASDQCNIPETVVLKGVGVGKVLTCAPEPVAFGYVPPTGVALEKQVTCTNIGNTDAVLSSFTGWVGLSPSQLPSSEFSRVVAPGQIAQVIIPKQGGQKTLTVAFNPQALGRRDGAVKFNTGLAKQTGGVYELLMFGFGGGPDIDVRPFPTLAFGKVAIFDGGTAPTVTRKITVSNLGSAPVTPAREANLLIERDGGTWYELRTLNGETFASEFKVEWAKKQPPNQTQDSYDPATGLAAMAGSNQATINVSLTPATEGLKQAELIIYSNDPDEAETKITISANVNLFEACHASIVPGSLNFGLITPPQYSDLAVTIRNLAPAGNTAATCLISGITLEGNSNVAFSLPANTDPSELIELAPQQTYNIKVRAYPQTGGSTLSTITGTLGFDISTPSDSHKMVPLSATVGTACLTIFPDEADFGAVKVDPLCRAEDKSFTVYNNCPAAVTLNSIIVTGPAGQPAGGPDCAGPGSCPEFTLITNPVSGGPISISQGSSVTFSARYKPIDISSDNGSITLNVTQSSQNVAQVINLEGEGNADGLNTDSFAQDQKPRADILIVIDDSCSMSSAQSFLSANFDKFLEYANAAGVDYHLAVTTTDMDEPAGRIVTAIDPTSSANPRPQSTTIPKILKRDSPDLKASFQAKVKVGTLGSGSETCTEPAVAALTAPLITDPGANGGFLRAEAKLAVLCVTDAKDQSAISRDVVLNTFLNIKGINRKGDFTFNAIGPLTIPKPTVCPAVSSYDDGGDTDGRLKFLIAQTNGVGGEICSADWATTLQEIGKIVFGFRTTFFLNAKPDLTKNPAIVVKIDDVVIDQVDPLTQSQIWRYEATNNAVVFEQRYVPEPGQNMTVSYYARCAP